jgi:hypothetical protein
MYFGFMCVCFLASPAFLDKFLPGFMSRINSMISTLRLPSSLQSKKDTALQNVTYREENNSSMRENVSYREESNSSLKAIV